MTDTSRFSKNLYHHNIEGVLQGGSLSSTAYEQSLLQVQEALEALRKKGEKGALPLLEVPFWKDDLKDIEGVVAAYRKFRSVLVIGTGGASLGARTLTALLQSWVMSESSFPCLYFLDNLDSEIFWEIMSVVNPNTTGVLVLSKSGETSETLIQLMRCIEYWQDFLSGEQLSQRITVITEPRPNTLRKIAEKFQLPCIDHPLSIGGRFSCLTLVGLLPAMIAGVTAKEVRYGAGYVLNQVFSHPSSAPAQGAAVIWGLAQEKKLKLHVMMPYGDVFAPFNLWYRQLWAESLGKEGRGFTPIHAMGPVDQHSQLQLYLDGPRDKFFTFFCEKQTARETVRSDLWAGLSQLNYLAYASISDLVQAELTATTHALVQRGCPVRLIEVPSLNEVTLGALFMHFMIETLVLGHLLGIDPFSQPAVDASKGTIRRFLTHPH